MDTVIDPGHSKGVRQRIEQSRPAVRAAKDFDAAFQEALRRKVAGLAPRPELEIDSYNETHVSIVHGAGRAIEQVGIEMVTADRELARAREERRELFAQREAARQKTYQELSNYREWARGILRPAGSKAGRCLNGDTEREPWNLLAQVRAVIAWAKSEQNPPPEPEVDFKLDWPASVSHLETLRDDLQAAIDAVTEATAKLSQPLEARLRAIKAFDREYQRGARLLERSFELVGLPSLAVAVRPHLKGTGRVGRPSKRPPVDRHPDLVTDLRTRGLLPTPAPATEETRAADRPRRRVVLRVASFRPLAATARPRKARRRPNPESQAKVTARLRRRRVVHSVPGIWPPVATTPARIVRPSPTQREQLEAAAVPPWAAKAFGWWQRQRDAS